MHNWQPYLIFGSHSVANWMTGTRYGVGPLALAIWCHIHVLAHISRWTLFLATVLVQLISLQHIIWADNFVLTATYMRVGRKRATPRNDKPSARWFRFHVLGRIIEKALSIARFTDVEYRIHSGNPSSPAPHSTAESGYSIRSPVAFRTNVSSSFSGVLGPNRESPIIHVLANSVTAVVVAD